MAAKPDIPLGDNHRRGISTTFRLLDKLLCEIEEYARGREVRSIFYREKNTLSADQKKGLLAEIKQMRDLMQEVKGGLGLDAEVENVAARIWGHSRVSGKSSSRRPAAISDGTECPRRNWRSISTHGWKSSLRT